MTRINATLPNSMWNVLGADTENIYDCIAVCVARKKTEYAVAIPAVINPIISATEDFILRAPSGDYCSISCCYPKQSRIDGK